MTTADTGAGRLDASGAPGRRAFFLAGLALTFETLCTVGRWAGLAWLAQGVLAGSRAAEVFGLAASTTAAILAVACGWAAGRLRERGARAVADQVRRELVEALLPTARRGEDTEPARAALAIVDLVDDVAGYHAQASPLRLTAPPSMLAVLAVTAAVHWPAALVLLLSTALMPLNLRLAGLFAQQGADQQLAATQRLNAVVLDSFRGIDTLRELGAITRRGRTLAAAAERLNTATMSVLRRAFLSGLIMDVVVTFSIAANATYIGLSLLGYVHVPDAPRVTPFTGLLVLLICPMYFTPARAAAASFHERARALTAASTIAATLTAAVDARRAPATEAPRPVPAEAVGVSLAAVRFRYPGSDEDAITADAEIAPGGWTAVTGASAAGKTTLLALIAGRRDPSAGRVEWTTSTLRRRPELGECAWIGQRTVLLDATVGDNIRIGRPECSLQDVRRAAAAAGLEPVLGRLPHGLDTRLGEGGWGISTGEARRIAIARALLRNARLWLLDEPTAHLDADSERAVLDALRRATDGCTVVVATHSFALTSVADTVLSIDDGVLRDVTPASVR